jgi:hypothetical protein
MNDIGETIEVERYDLCGTTAGARRSLSTAAFAVQSMAGTPVGDPIACPRITR